MGGEQQGNEEERENQVRNNDSVLNDQGYLLVIHEDLETLLKHNRKEWKNITHHSAKGAIEKPVRNSHVIVQL